MEIPNLESRVHELLREHLGLATKQINLGTRLREELGMDSLDGVQLMLAAEAEFGITISDEQVSLLKTVGDLVALVSTSPTEAPNAEQTRHEP